MGVHAGRVTSINEHHANSRHVSIGVTHGKRKRTKGKDGEPGDLVGYDRPESRVVLPRDQAKQYSMGQRVNVNLTPADGDEDDDDETAAPVSAKAPKKAPPKAVAKKGAKSRGPIFAAMTHSKK